MDNQQGKLPENFIERLTTYIPEEKLNEVLYAFSAVRPITFRVNTLKTTHEKLKEVLEQQGFKIQNVNWYKEAFILGNKSKKDLMETEGYKNGQFYIQNLSSMIPSLILNPQPNDIILDMAASPGSKTTHLAALMKNNGTIIANDKSPKRIFKLIHNLKEQGVSNTITSAIPGEFLWRKYPNYFDKVLLDAPCSMEGRFSTEDEDSYKGWSPKKIKELSNLQKWMLRSAISCTKIGGTIVYSTCAMDPMENEAVVDWALEKMGDTIQLVDIELPHIKFDEGLRKWKNKKFTNEVKKTVRIYPTELFEGFFIAKFIKISPSLN